MSCRFYWCLWSKKTWRKLLIFGTVFLFISLGCSYIGCITVLAETFSDDISQMEYYELLVLRDILNKEINAREKASCTQPSEGYTITTGARHMSQCTKNDPALMNETIWWFYDDPVGVTSGYIEMCVTEMLTGEDAEHFVLNAYKTNTKAKAGYEYVVLFIDVLTQFPNGGPLGSLSATYFSAVRDNGIAFPVPDVHGTMGNILMMFGGVDTLEVVLLTDVNNSSSVNMYFIDDHFGLLSTTPVWFHLEK